MRNIYLIGFMGAGKSTIGGILAGEMGLDFVDSDDLIEKMAGSTIPQIFSTQGENHFRDLETEVITDLVNTSDLVASLGGGAPVRDRNRRMLKKGISIYLNVSPRTILKRTGGDKRPLLAGLNEDDRLQKIISMLEHREKYYHETADMIVTNDNRSPRKVALEIINELSEYERNKD